MQAGIPAILKNEAEKLIQQFNECSPEYAVWLSEKLQNDSFAQELNHTWSCSRFAADLCNRKPATFQSLVESGRLHRSNNESQNDSEMSALLKAELPDDINEESLNSTLRKFRNREMLRIIWRDLNRLADLQETTRDITALAECCLQQALDFHHAAQRNIYGRPLGKEKDQCIEQQLIVIGMGKLGAWELNLSSDIDLIFCYPKAGQTDGARSLDNHEFFTRVARKLIHSLDSIAADGFVFRVDMRLRPYGESGALVLSFDAMEEYYQDQGRDWERYAMIKARVVAGDSRQGENIMAMLRPFVYRRYIDFSAIDSLRAMKRMIRQEVKRRHLDKDVKLGAGGIREIEFIAQCFQLIRGGREPAFQERRVLKVLEVIAAEGLMPLTVVNELREAYCFLRNTEHAIQAYSDQQTQTLPSSAYTQAALAHVMGFADWESFYAQLCEHRQRVDHHFANVIAEPEEHSDAEQEAHWQGVWLGHYEEPVALDYLQAAGFEMAQQTYQRLQLLRNSSQVSRMQVEGRQRLDEFMPLLLEAVTEVQSPSATLLQIFPLIEAVLRRTAYLVLLVENPGALKQLVLLCAASPWIAEQLARFPVLLDELLDVRTLYQVPEKAALREDLLQQMLRLNWDDLEAHMEVLRYFKLAHRLHVTAAEVTGRLPLMKVSDYLTMIVEVILEHVLELAWHDLISKHGYPQKAPGVVCDKDFIVVGYGKVGGIELGHSSDLDLVFLHDAASGLATDGERSIDNSLFFTRLGQRMIHILTALTPTGQLYEVDMRLRPSGASGLLVSSLTAFATYQRQEAWTWEHQALVRARVVAGDPALADKFARLRRDLLCEPRDPQRLGEEVVKMRHKMREHLLPKGLEQRQPPVFHLKQGRGAIVDIEFMVQYAVLVWSHQHPALSEISDNIRILEILGKDRKSVV